MSLATPDRRGFLREAALVAAAMLAYFLVRNLTVGSAEEAFANAQRIVAVERWAHIGWEEDVQASVAGATSWTGHARELDLHLGPLAGSVAVESDRRAR